MVDDHSKEVSFKACCTIHSCVCMYAGSQIGRYVNSKVHREAGMHESICMYECIYTHITHKQVCVYT